MTSSLAKNNLSTRHSLHFVLWSMLLLNDELFAEFSHLQNSVFLTTDNFFVLPGVLKCLSRVGFWRQQAKWKKLTIINFFFVLLFAGWIEIWRTSLQMPLSK